MVGHLLEYHPGVEKLNQLVSSGELGDVHYVYSNRLNLGKHRQDENALWSLGAHDVSVILRLAGEEPFECDAVGESYVKPGVEDVVFALLRFPSGLVAHMHLSWLDPHKERRFTVVGSRRMATFDDMELERKLTVYDKGFDEDYSSYGEYIARSGDVSSPRISNEEPLRIECAPLHRVRPRRQGAAIGARVRAARRARAGAAPALARGELECLPAAELTPSERSPGLLLGDGVELPETWSSAGTSWCTPARASVRAAGCRTAA